MAQTGIRDYLRSRGLNDNEITYDNGTVYAKGRRFIDATPQSDNKTYADSRTLDNAYGDYDVRDQLAQLRTRATQPNQQLTSMQQAIQERINRPVQQFSYNAETDPQYQAALRTAQQNAQTAGNNAMVALGSRGIGNSSITSDRVAQIGNREMGRVTSEVLPQLLNQAYQRYMGQQQLENQQLGNMMNAYRMYSDQDQQQFGNSLQALQAQNQYTQQQFANDRAVAQERRQNKLDNESVAQWYSQQYGVPIDAKEDWKLVEEQVKGLTPLAMQQYLQQKAMQEAGLTGSYNGNPTMAKLAQDFNQKQAMEQLAISRMNAGTSAMSARNSAGNARMNQLLDIYRATGRAPSGLETYGVQPGTAYYNPNQSASKVNTNQFEAEVIANLNKMTPEQQQRFFDDEAATLINSVGLSGMNKIYNQYFDKEGNPKRK